MVLEKFFPEIFPINLRPSLLFAGFIFTSLDLCLFHRFCLYLPDLSIFRGICAYFTAAEAFTTVSPIILKKFSPVLHLPPWPQLHLSRLPLLVPCQSPNSPWALHRQLLRRCTSKHRCSIPQCRCSQGRASICQFCPRSSGLGCFLLPLDHRLLLSRMHLSQVHHHYRRRPLWPSDLPSPSSSLPSPRWQWAQPSSFSLTSILWS